MTARCLRCGRRPHVGENRFDHLIDGPHCCQLSPRLGPGTRGPGGPRCGGLLSEQPVHELDARHPLVRSQMWIDRILATCAETDRQVIVAGLEVPPGTALAAAAALMGHIVILDTDLSTLQVTHLANGRPGQGLQLPAPDRSRPVGGTYSIVAEDPALFGVAAALAFDVLAASSLDAAIEAETLRRLLPVKVRNNELARQTNVSLLHTRAPTGSAVIDAIVLRAHAPNIAAAWRLSYRTKNAVPRRPAGTSQGTSPGEWPFTLGRMAFLPVRLVPQTVWPSVSDEMPASSHQDTAAFRWPLCGAAHTPTGRTSLSSSCFRHR
jgi:hypothetical protein